MTAVAAGRRSPAPRPARTGRTPRTAAAADAATATGTAAAGPASASLAREHGAAHPLLTGLGPVADARTRAVLLGSFPGVASLAAQQYYGHPRNDFWRLLGAVWGVDLAALPYAARLEVLRARGLGVWDVYAACRRPGSLDASITHAQPNDLASLRVLAPALRWALHNGGESARAMRVTRALGLQAVRLPSSSPANASWSFDRKRQAWAEALRRAGVA